MQIICINNKIDWHFERWINCTLKKLEEWKIYEWNKIDCKCIIEWKKKIDKRIIEYKQYMIYWVWRFNIDRFQLV